MTDQQALNRVLRHFARTMAAHYDTTQVLYDLSDSLVEVLGATAAGVAILDDGDLRFVTATSDAAGEAERIQEQLQSGPCVESVHTNRPVAVEDVRECEGRWPDYTSRIHETGLRGVLGIPLVLDDRQIGSLDVYSAEPRHWDDEAIDAAQVLADIGAAYLLNASELAQAQRTADQLQTALDSRVVIEQAKGVLAERLGVSTSEAFQRIRASARRHSTKIDHVCRRVIESGYIPD
jgi:GAF domain-containing protein